VAETGVGPGDYEPSEEPIFAAPGPAPETRMAWVVIGVVLVVVVAGIAFVASKSVGPGGSQEATAIVTLSSPKYGSILCQTGGPIYYETYFPITTISGGLLTSEFGLAILTDANVTVAPGGSAPTPIPGLPCSAPPPSGWYVILTRGTAAAVATFPQLSYGSTRGVWSNSTTSPQSIGPGEDFVFVTSGDFTGSGDRLVSDGYDSTIVNLEGNTTFPPYQKP
jgi:hypothetical protein